MRSHRSRLLVGLALVSSVACLVAMVFVAGDAEAQRGRRGRGSRRGAAASAAPDEAPQSAGIAPALGELRWGLSPEETFNHLKGQVEESYRERLQKAARTDAIQEDRLRQQMADETRRLRASYTRFRGQASGWDTAFIRDEFTHGNNESMMVWRDEATHSQRFYFFINDRLWKLFQAFDSSVFPGATFDQFSEAIQGRFGRGVQRSGALVEGRAPSQWIEWQDASTRLRAIDHTRFYGFFCLVFEDKSTLQQLPQLRSHTIQRGGEGHALVESVVRADGEETAEAGDRHADVADRISGQIRRRQDAPADSSSSGASSGSSSPGSSSPGSSSPGSSSSGSSSSGSSSSGSSSSRRSDPDDPFGGMDL